MKCPLCKNSESGIFPIYYEFEGKEFAARKCSRCSFVYLVPRPDAGELAKMYSNDYFLHEGSDYGVHSDTSYEKTVLHEMGNFPVILNKIKKYKTCGKFFEVGAAMGYFLNYAAQNGFEASGIEYSEMCTSVCKDKFGLSVQNISFEQYDPGNEKYDVIYMGDVLEHLVEPLEMLVKARNMLAPGGVIVVEVPAMFNCIVGRLAISGYGIMKTRRLMPMPPYHVNEFMPATLKSMLREAGFAKTYIHQDIKNPNSIPLRGTAFEKAGKKILQYPNYLITKTFGVLGDRLMGIGIQET